MQRRNLTVLFLAALVTSSIAAVTLAARPASAGDSVKVTVLDAGCSPRKELRYRFDVDRPERLVLSMNMKISIKMGEMAMPEQTIPEVNLTMTISPRELTDEGNLRVEFGVDSVGGGGGMIPSDAMEGFRGWLLITPRGETLDARFEAPDDATPAVQQLIDNLKQTMGQMSVPLPEEAVGAGARWQADMTIDSGPLTIEQTAIYTLAELTDRGAKLEIVLEQTAAAQELKNVGMLPGMKLMMHSLESSGSGTTHLDLGKLVSDSDIRIEMAMAGDMTIGDQTQAMSMKLEMGIKMTAAE